MNLHLVSNFEVGNSISDYLYNASGIESQNSRILLDKKTIRLNLPVRRTHGARKRLDEKLARFSFGYVNFGEFEVLNATLRKLGENYRIYHSHLI